MGCVVSALGSNICIWCFHYDSHQHSIGRIGWEGGVGRMAHTSPRMNICKEAPHVDLAFAQAAPLIGSHRQYSTCLSALAPLQVACCLCLQMCGAV
jgi:hypothetical protein